MISDKRYWQSIIDQWLDRIGNQKSITLVLIDFIDFRQELTACSATDANT